MTPDDPTRQETTMHEPTPENTTLRRLDQIERTAHRVRPVDVGEWRTATGLTHGAADAVVIAPADLRWMLEGLRAYAAQTAESEATR